jgi:hypothetical protein
MTRMSKRQLASLLVCFALAGLRAAHAQMLNDVEIDGANAGGTHLGSLNGTIGTSAVEVVPSLHDNATGFPPAWSSIFIANDSATASIACGYSPGVTVNGAGTFPIPPQSAFSWPPGTAPGNQRIWCIASAASTPFFAKIGVP